MFLGVFLCKGIRKVEKGLKSVMPILMMSGMCLAQGQVDHKSDHPFLIHSTEGGGVPCRAAHGSRHWGHSGDQARHGAHFECGGGRQHVIMIIRRDWGSY